MILYRYVWHAENINPLVLGPVKSKVRTRDLLFENCFRSITNRTSYRTEGHITKPDILKNIFD